MTVTPYLRCEDCRKEFSGPEPFTQHIKSKAHLKKVSQKSSKATSATPDSQNPTVSEVDKHSDDNQTQVTPYSRCEDCNKEFSGPEPYRQHIISKSHLKKASVKISEPGFNLVGEPVSSVGQFHCETCKINLSGPEPLKQHLLGNKHRSQLNKQRILRENQTPADVNLPELIQRCDYCQKCFSGPESYEEHAKSKKHQRKVEMANIKEVSSSSERNASLEFFPKGNPPKYEHIYRDSPYPDEQLVPDLKCHTDTGKKKQAGCKSAFKSLLNCVKTQDDQ